MDANNFKLFNKISHIIGDLAIKNIGNTLRNATMQITHSKLFRSGGDEFVLYCENRDDVFVFIEHAIKELDQLVIEDLIVALPVKITLSFGIGITYNDAELALAEAKNKKTKHAMNLVHSNI